MLQGVNQKNILSPRKIWVNLINPWKYFKSKVNLGLTHENILSPRLTWNLQKIDGLTWG